MSGVGITGLIANLPGTITPYPTQDPNLELGGKREVADTTARDAIPANFRTIGMLVTVQNTGATYQLVGGITNANWQLFIGQAPFRGTYHVDPAFTGIQLGSESNPFTSIAATFAFAVTAAVANGIIFLAPGTNTTENVTFPLTGDWEIAAQPGQASLTTSITGNVDCSASASCRRAFTNIRVIGNITGNCSAGTQRILFAGAIVNALTLTVSGGGVQRVASRSGTSAAAVGGNIQSCIFLGAVSIAGTYWGSDAIFNVSLTVSTASSFSFCDMPPTTTTNGAAQVDMFMTNCSNAVGGSLAFTASSGSMRIRADAATLSEFYRVGLVLTGTVSTLGLLGQGASRVVQVTNVPSTQLCGVTPASLMVIDACLTLLTNAGATAGNAVLNVIYTDMTGTLVTEPVTTTLNVAGAVGSKARGSLQISQNGATPVSFSVTGITNATSLTYECDVAGRQVS